MQEIGPATAAPLISYMRTAQFCKDESQKKCVVAAPKAERRVDPPSGFCMAFIAWLRSLYRQVTEHVSYVSCPFSGGK